MNSYAFEDGRGKYCKPLAIVEDYCVAQIKKYFHQNAKLNYL